MAAGRILVGTLLSGCTAAVHMALRRQLAAQSSAAPLGATLGLGPTVGRRQSALICPSRITGTIMGTTTRPTIAACPP